MSNWNLFPCTIAILGNIYLKRILCRFTLRGVLCYLSVNHRDQAFLPECKQVSVYCIDRHSDFFTHHLMHSTSESTPEVTCFIPGKVVQWNKHR